MPRLSLAQVLEAAPRHLDVYRARTAPLSRADKGIRRSELFFLYAAVADLAPRRIVESGRARAQSTLVLSAIFPEAEIISVESDAHSADTAIAAERLAGRKNVECRFGDSRVLLPQIVENGDIVLIDGPKDFRAVKLALELLRSGKPAAVFVHDLWRGSPARSYVDRSLRSAFLSDAPAWVRRYAELDSRERTPPDFPDDARLIYGATLGCFPGGTENYAARLVSCSVAQGLERLAVNAGRWRRPSEQDRPPDFTILA